MHPRSGAPPGRVKAPAMPRPKKKPQTLGRALQNQHNLPGGRGAGGSSQSSRYRHTTDLDSDPAAASRPSLQSVIERNDLEELVALAQLANHDFSASADPASLIVLSSSSSGQAASNRAVQGGEKSDDDRDDEDEDGAGGGDSDAADPELEAATQKAMVVPRRPPWYPGITREQLDANERSAFLEWRRALAAVEHTSSGIGGQGTVVTPFEKNLEVWRQLWRVVERSHLVVQVR